MHVQSVQKYCFFIVKYAHLWGFCCSRRRGYLSSLMLAKCALSELENALLNEIQGIKIFFCLLYFSPETIKRLICVFCLFIFLNRTARNCSKTPLERAARLFSSLCQSNS